MRDRVDKVNLHPILSYSNKFIGFRLGLVDMFVVLCLSYPNLLSIPSTPQALAPALSCS